MSTEAYVCEKEGALLKKQTIELPKLLPHQVRVKMTHCGLCHTDCHMMKNDWGASCFPMVPGHEGVGTVIEVGDMVKTHKVGEHVGIGWIRASCTTCDNCLKGFDNICLAGYQGTYLGSAAMYGCFAKEMVIDARFAFPIPPEIPLAYAAPLLCAGITVYSPLRDYAECGTRVGIISVGGLGHLAIQFAKAMGCEVTVFSGSPKKEDECRKFGAHKFVCSKDPKAMEAQAGTLELILNTCPNRPNHVSEHPAPERHLVYMGIASKDAQPIQLQHMPLIFQQKKVVGSIVGGARYSNEMMRVAATHNIKPDIECVPFDKVNEACDRLLAGDLQAYRLVLVHEGGEEKDGEPIFTKARRSFEVDAQWMTDQLAKGAKGGD
ncbi:unnamed protein product [Vitrella brassicaformis CCMP3155]|uniref:Enoyl reductase (ER) domain-containing protein n=2 Tax=Vitrella brassicaformis TaxID=1169539 RepID=A0A0G4H2Q8_VITBC|nr:unnamed protein product [Vitrella brassicaformis CCMP3155]|mmetsp:Transcript_47445/g.118533  ORF Transcript_47445/g.118533 Transcript_47445/m.118533 type:complete len:378 (+) Transcript_47445:129-1262(+)|eukprot:CEM37828.1 unnamed protein product [Vitrella brassicaformis CCMP3155]